MSASLEIDEPRTVEEAPFQLRGQSMTTMVLKLFNAADPNLFALLAAQIGQAPNFFRHAPVVLDVTDCPGASINFATLIPGLKKLGLIPVGIQGGPVDIQSAAANAGLGVFRVSRPQRDSQTVLRVPPQDESPVAGTSEPVSPRVPVPDAPVASRGRGTGMVAGEDDRVGVASPALVVTEPVRSGRQIYAANADLIVLAPVSPGAELLADGNIHVYGTLRGRALAGLSGDVNARIFAQSLEAELISIAGLYRVAEDIEPAARGKAAQVYREGDALRICPLGGQDGKS